MSYASPLKVKTDKQPTSFQKELKNRMRERKNQGLAADITESESGHGSQDELDSENGELIAYWTRFCMCRDFFNLWYLLLK